MRPSAQDALGIGILAAVYAITAVLGLRMDAVSDFATLVWAPTGLSIAALLLFGRRLWPGVAMGAFAANLWNGASVPLASGIAVGNTFEALLAAWILGGAGDFRTSLDRLRDAVRFVFAVLAGATVSATGGVASLFASGAASERLFETWRAWWVGDVIGGLVVAPLLLVWWSRRPEAGRKPHAALPARLSRHATTIEVLGLLITTVGIGALVFFSGAPSDRSFRQAYMVFPVIAWASLRFELRGATAVTFALSVLAVTGTALSSGPFTSTSLNESLLRLQVFMGVAVTTGLFLAAVTAERRAAQRAAAAAANALEEFLSVASHELRSPLQAVLLELVGLQRMARASSGTDTRVDTKLDRALANSRRLGSLVERLFDLSRVTAGQLVIHREASDLATIVRNAVDRLAPEAERARCVIELRTQPGTSGEWDPFRIDQVATNLLSNAVKYGAGGRVEIDVLPAEGHARLVVRDHGIGIPPPDRERVFERFARTPAAQGYGGLGLGLYIARQIVEAHGGSIRAESPPGGGAAFVVELPLRR